MMEVKIKVSDVDYAAAIDALLPVLADKLSSCSNPIAALAFGKAKSFSTSAAKAALHTLPEKVKDDLAAACLNHYSGDLSQVISDIANRQNIPLKVHNIEAAASS